MKIKLQIPTAKTEVEVKFEVPPELLAAIEDRLPFKISFEKTDKK